MLLHSQIISSLRKLRSASRCFETVFLTLFHTRITCEIAGLLDDRTKFRIHLDEGTCEAVADSAGLTCVTAAADCHIEVIFAESIDQRERLADDNLEGFRSEIIIDVTLIDNDLASSLRKEYSGDRTLSSSCTVKSFACQLRILPNQYLRVSTSGF